MHKREITRERMRCTPDRFSFVHARNALQLRNFLKLAGRKDEAKHGGKLDGEKRTLPRYMQRYERPCSAKESAYQRIGSEKAAESLTSLWLCAAP